MSSQITEARMALVDRISNAGLAVKSGFIAQFLTEIPARGLVCIQPASEPSGKFSSASIDTSRAMTMVLAVPAGPDQDKTMDDLLLSLRKALFSKNPMRSLSGTSGNHFTIDQGVTFFLPEGHEYLFCAEQQITLRYRDEL